jgi:predicted metal-dependent hydrolase
MKYKINGIYYDVIIEKKNNKNTYIRVKDDLTIHVTTNYFTSKRSILTLLRNNHDSLITMIDEKLKQQEKENNFYYMGRKYDIIVVSTLKTIEFDENHVYVKSMDSLNRWYKKEMKNLFKEKIDYYYNQFEEDIPYPILKIRKMKTRWGVCNKRDDSITLNSNLMKYDVSALEYVVVHELSHFVHFDHSKQFWETVKKYYPNYKRSIALLKD